MRRLAMLPFLGAALLTVFVGTGCETQATCLFDCGDANGVSNGTGQGARGQIGGRAGHDGGAGATGGGNIFGTGGSGAMNAGGGPGAGGCATTNDGVEICDRLDNDCNGNVDDGIDFKGITHCGTCANNCYKKLINAQPNSIVCTWDGMANTPGACSFAQCAPDYHDLDSDGQSCEYFCVKTANDDSVCNNTDDDCDGLADEDVNLCTDTANCGACGMACSVVHGSGTCANDGNMPCTTSNTQCAILECDDDNNDGSADWWDLDKSYITGCEYQCSLTNGGIEICGDGIDNDCDGKIDGADDLSGDPQIGVLCFGDPDGLCATAAHAGATQCDAGKVVCGGPNILVQDQTPESCNGVDDDCDIVIDDNPAEVGKACGASNIFPCSFGTTQCQNGSPVCVGGTLPKLEICNGIDDDCDGGVDTVLGAPPSDAGGACDVPIPPPVNATSACKAGTLTCFAGVLICQNAVGPSAPSDSCGVDANCDGVLGEQPDLNADLRNCGACGNDCLALDIRSFWTCGAGICVHGGCKPGFHDLDGDNVCEYACIALGAEQCNGVDDDCNGTIDDGVIPPTTAAVCGTAPGALSPECTTLVNMACVSGSWQCTFPSQVCAPDCATATEICDGLDNDCNGALNENVPNYGQPCASDDGQPFPGHGACRTIGIFDCISTSATACNAIKANCATLPGGCTEICDGIDNDCDGSTDETYQAKGLDTTNFVQPAVTKIGASRWMFSHEASRPGADDLDAGSGNGYFCTGLGCDPLPPAPAGTVLDQTIACSKSDVLPWFNVTPVEVEQSCNAIGGHICDATNWTNACQATNACTWGYSPRGPVCQTAADNVNTFCNLGAFDFSNVLAGDQNGLLVTASPDLGACAADWSGLLGNTTNPSLFDVTGNLREITKLGDNIYPIMGGAFNTFAEAGAACDFSFFIVDQDFLLFDTGFRCCFSVDPTL